MMKRHNAIFGIYLNRNDAEKAIEMLETDGFKPEDLSLLVPTKEAQEDSGNKEIPYVVEQTRATEGGFYGTGAGTILGGALGLLIGVGSLTVPGVGPFIAAGPVMSVLGGMGVGGMAGGFIGAMVGFGMPEFEATKFEECMRRGCIFLGVHADEPEDIFRAKQILNQTGAQSVTYSRESEEIETQLAQSFKSNGFQQAHPHQ